MVSINSDNSQVTFLFLLLQCVNIKNVSNTTVITLKKKKKPHKRILTLYLVDTLDKTLDRAKKTFQILNTIKLFLRDKTIL